jgi:RNA polymerase sigma-70 factor (ECF subfamily)
VDLDSLIVRFKQKDVQAFEDLHQMYATNICGVIHTILRDKERAEELTQDVFVKVWNYAESYDSSKGRFFTWILNIARNAAIDELRSKTHKQQKQNLHTDYFVDIADSKEDDVLGIDTNRLRALVKGLGKKCKQMLDLLYFKGLTQKETAGFLDIPLGTVKTRNRSCISRLRKNMTL